MKLLGRGLLESKHEFRLLFLTIGRNHSVSCYPRTYLVTVQMVYGIMQQYE